MSPGARTVTDLLESRLRADAGRPLITAYDDTTGERTELSVTTYLNWVSKTANLLTDELGLDAGDTVLVDLPAHWLVPVFAGAAWVAGLSVTTDPAVDHALAVRGPDPGAAGGALGPAGTEVLACSLRPFAVRYAEALPPGVHDYGVLWPGQSDVFVPVVAPSPDTAAYVGTEGTRSHAELVEAAAATAHAPRVRLMTDVHPLVAAGVPALLGPLAHDGSVVLVRRPDASRWAERAAQERVTEELRASADHPPS